MLQAFLFDKNHRVLLVKFGRVLTRAVIDDHVRAGRAFLATDGRCRGILDLSAVEEIDVDVAYLRAMGGSRRVMPGEQRVIVAPRDEVFGVSRLYGLHQANSQGEEPMVVRDLQEAYDALGLKDPDLQPFEVSGSPPE